jgi:hypothetical protein
MSKRLMSSSIWTSRKIAALPEWARPEFAWLHPIANSYGCFEADPRVVWSMAFSCSRPNFTEQRVSELLDEFHRAGLLFRWTDEHGRKCGYWVGSSKSGLLPPPSERAKADGEFPQPPIDQLLAYEGRQGVGTAYEQPTDTVGTPEPVSSRGTSGTPDPPNIIPRASAYEEPTPTVGNASYGLVGLGEDRVGGESKTAPLASDKEEVPTGLHQLNYATRLLEDLGLPASTNVTQLVASAISSFAKKEKVEKCEAYTRMLKRAKEDQEQGIEINRFWFDDGRYLPKSPVKAPASATPAKSQYDNGEAEKSKAKARAWIAENPEEAVKRDEEYRNDGSPGYLERFIPREEAEKMRAQAAEKQKGNSDAPTAIDSRSEGGQDQRGTSASRIGTVGPAFDRYRRPIAARVVS